MKKYLLMLLSAIAFVACSNDEEGTNVIQPIKALADVEAFFTAELAKQHHFGQTPFDFPKQEQMGIFQIRYHVVDSEEELARLYNGEAPLPEIDFATSTLILGLVIFPNGTYLLDKVTLQEEEKLLRLNVYPVLSNDGGIAAFYGAPFWHLYPKLPNKPLVVDVVENAESLRTVTDSIPTDSVYGQPTDSINEVIGSWYMSEKDAGWGGIHTFAPGEIIYRFYDEGVLSVQDPTEHAVFLGTGTHRYALDKEKGEITIDGSRHGYRFNDHELIIDTGSAYDWPLYKFHKRKV